MPHKPYLKDEEPLLLSAIITGFFPPRRKFLLRPRSPLYPRFSMCQIFVSALVLSVGSFLIAVTEGVTIHPVEVDLKEHGGSSFKGNLRINGVSYNLHLTQPDDTIFDPNFSLSLTHSGPNDTVQIRDVQVNPGQIRQQERTVYTDDEAGAVLKVHRPQGKEIRLHGFLNNLHITHNGQSHIALVHDDPMEDPLAHFYSMQNLTAPDVVPEQEAPLRIESRQAVASRYPELYIVMDNRAYNDLGRNWATVVDYVALFVRGVNNRFFTMKNPRVWFIVTGILAIQQPAHQPFMESSKVPDGSGTYDMDAVLNKFAKYMYKHQNDWKGHDIAPLLSGNTFKSRSGNQWVAGVEGLAYITGACKIEHPSQINYKTAVVSDRGATFRGVYSMAHELGHSLGAPHDGEGNAQSCAWANGNVMSYQGWGTEKKFYWSSCSANLIRNYINSGAGWCLRSYQNPSSYVEAKGHPGQRYNLYQQCRRFTGRNDAQVDSRYSLDDQCRNLRCTYKAPCGSTSCTWFVTANVMPLDGSPCGASGQCWYGKCSAVAG